MKPGDQVVKNGKTYIVAADGKTLMPLMPGHRVRVTAPPAMGIDLYRILAAAAVALLVMRQSGQMAIGAVAGGAVWMFWPQIAGALNLPAVAAPALPRSRPVAQLPAGELPPRPWGGAGRSF